VPSLAGLSVCVCVWDGGNRVGVERGGGSVWFLGGPQTDQGSTESVSSTFLFL